MHIYYINKIIESDDNEKMEKLKDILVNTITYLKGTDYDKYREIECKLYEIVEGKKLTLEKAQEWVKGMPEHWTMEETNSVRKVNIPEIDFYVLMNMLYSDYHDVIGDNLDTYIKLAMDWYNDADIPMDGSEKLYCYWKHFAKKT